MLSGMWDILLKWEKESEDAVLDNFMNHSRVGKKMSSPELVHEVLISMSSTQIGSITIFQVSQWN
jgi:hypothetical protein